MRRIRPHHVFSLVPAGLGRVTLDLPNRFAGEPLFLEKAILLALLRASAPRRIFEFGTYLGATAKMFKANAPNAEVVTLDLPDGHPGSSPAADDAHLIAESKPDLLAHGIRQIRCDSNDLPVEKLGHFDFIWIDGGHDLRTLTSDTENAYRIRSASPHAVIAWHDYGNPKYPELTEFLDSLSEIRPLMHVEETLLVVDSLKLWDSIA